MPAEKEILKYELDLTDVEAKAARLQELVGQVKKRKGEGGDTSELDAQVQKEIESLGKLSGKQKEAGQGAEGLLHQHRALASVVELVGGSFGGLVGQVSRVIELFRSAGTAVAGVAGGMAVLAILVQVFQAIGEAARKAAEAVERFNDASAAAQRAKAGLVGAAAEALEALGARSERNIKSALEIEKVLGKVYGVAPERAGKVAPVAVAAGVGAEDAARLAVLIGEGAAITTPMEATAALAQAREQGTYATLLEVAKQHAKDLAGRAVRTAARTPTGGLSAEVSATRAIFEELKAQPGGLEARGIPSDTSFGMFEAAMRGDVHAVMKAMPRPTDVMFQVRQAGRPEMVTTEMRGRAEALVREVGWAKTLVKQQIEAEQGALPGAGAPLLTEPEPVPTGRAVKATVASYERWRAGQMKAPSRAGQWPPESSAEAEAGGGEFVGPPAELAGEGAPAELAGAAPSEDREAELRQYRAERKYDPEQFAPTIHYHDTINIGTQIVSGTPHSGRGLRPQYGASGELDERAPN